jgi:hypothetical protein
VCGVFEGISAEAAQREVLFRPVSVPLVGAGAPKGIPGEGGPRAMSEPAELTQRCPECGGLPNRPAFRDPGANCPACGLMTAYYCLGCQKAGASPRCPRCYPEEAEHRARRTVLAENLERIRASALSGGGEYWWLQFMLRPHPARKKP